MQDLPSKPVKEPVHNLASPVPSGKSSSVKIYDRPERKGLSPLALLIAIAVGLVLLLWLVFKYWH